MNRNLSNGTGLQETRPPRTASWQPALPSAIAFHALRRINVNLSMRFKPSLDWLLIFVPVALVLRFWPGLSNPTALFICSAIAIIPVAGWIGHATEALATRWAKDSADY